MSLNMFLGGLPGRYTSGSSQMAKQQAAEAAEQARASAAQVMELERRLDKLSMVAMAMWSFIQQKLDVTEKQLMDRVNQIDLMDGRADGKMKKRELAKCPKCGRIMSPHHPRCIYCGAEKLNIGVFDDVL